jgi:hypothetical protein
MQAYCLVSGFDACTLYSQKPNFCRIQYLCIPYFMKACGARIKILNEIFTHFQFILSSKLQTIMLICAALLKHKGLRRDEETLQPSVYLNKYVSFFLTTLFIVSYTLIVRACSMS